MPKETLQLHIEQITEKWMLDFDGMGLSMNDRMAMARILAKKVYSLIYRLKRTKNEELEKEIQ